MRTKKPAGVTIINKNYPPNPGITGESANELAAFLESKGIAVSVVYTDAVYSRKTNDAVPVGNLIRVRSIYNGKNKILRLGASFIESYRMAKAAAGKTDGTIITMTDPPFLIFWSSILFKKRKWAYWSMDLYPQAFIAARLVGRNNILYRWFKRVVNNNPPDFILSLGRQQKDYLLKDYNRNIPGTELPCGIWDPNKKNTNTPEWKSNAEKIYFGYCGNLGEAHSLEFVTAVIAQLDPEKHCFILAVYGSQANALEKFAADYPVVKKVSSVSKNELPFIDIHLVTLKKEWDHVCVPSKAVTAICTGATMLFCGSRENDNWYYLEKAGWMIDETGNLQEQARTFVHSLTPETIAARKQAAAIISNDLNKLKLKAFEDVETFVLK